jgi:mannose-1-phosphate guanylyltransferase / phosphomannomutase
MKKAVFLDRDGTVTQQTEDLSDIKDLRLISGAAHAIQILNRAGFLIFIHTNQPVIARGKLTEEKLHSIHEVLLKRLRRKGARVDEIYYCPHHPIAPLEKYRMVCECRKPKTLLVKKAAQKYDIDLKISYTIGDSTRDILTGKRAHTVTILVQTGNAGKDGRHVIKPDYEVKNLLAAAYLIKKNLPRISPRQTQKI